MSRVIFPPHARHSRPATKVEPVSKSHQPPFFRRVGPSSPGKSAVPDGHPSLEAPVVEEAVVEEAVVEEAVVEEAPVVDAGELDEDLEIEWSPAMRKAELTKIAISVGLDVAPTATKAQIIKQLEGL